MTDFLQKLFLESPVYLGVASFVALAAALLSRQRWLERPAVRRWLLPGTVVLVALLFLVQSAVTTQRERILATLDEFVAAIEAGDSVRAARFVGAGFDDGRMDREQFVAFLEGRLARIDIYDTRYHRRDVVVNGTLADMVLAARATVSANGGVGQMHWGRWRLQWAREGDEWKITDLRPEMIDGVEINSLSDLRGAMP